MQRGEVGLERFLAGMKIDFAQSLGKLLEQVNQSTGGHAASIGEAEDAISGADAEAAQGTRGGGAERAEDERDGREISRLADEAEHFEITRGERREQGAQDDGMKMQMRVTVGVGAAETEFAKTRELLGDLVAERFGGARVEGVTQSGERGRFGEARFFIRERREPRGATGTEREVQADAKGGIAMRNAHGFLDGEFIYHEARLGEQAGLVMAFDRFVDRAAATEVVAGEDEVFHGARSRPLGTADHADDLTTDNTDDADEIVAQRHRLARSAARSIPSVTFVLSVVPPSAGCGAA